MNCFPKTILLFTSLVFNQISEGFVFQSLFHPQNNQPLTTTLYKDNDVLSFGRLSDSQNTTTIKPVITTGTSSCHTNTSVNFKQLSQLRSIFLDLTYFIIFLLKISINSLLYLANSFSFFGDLCFSIFYCC